MPTPMGSIDFGLRIVGEDALFQLGRGSYQLDGSTVLALLHARNTT